MHQEILEKRLLRIERYIDALRHHLFITNQILLNLATEVADLKCETQQDSSLCQKIQREIDSLQSLRNLSN
jgi:hypothetical protein